MKATVQIGHGSAKHNDRSYQRTGIINNGHQGVPTKMNCVYFENGKPTQHIVDCTPNATNLTLQELELEYYKTHFKPAVDAQNQRNIVNGHPERNKTIEQVYADKKTKPHEMILQLGSAIDQPDSVKELVRASVNLQYYISQKYPQFKTINMVLHTDETTPHIHMRFVLADRDGRINLSQALRDMNVNRPNLNKKESRYNCPQMTLTADIRAKFEELGKAQGLDLDTNHVKTRHKTVKDFKYSQIAKEQQEVQNLRNQKAQMESEINQLNNKLESTAKTLGMNPNELKKLLQTPNSYDFEQNNKKAKAIATIRNSLDR